MVSKHEEKVYKFVIFQLRIHIGNLLSCKKKNVTLSKVTLGGDFLFHIIQYNKNKLDYILNPCIF